MNTGFMRLLAERLEHLCWVEVVPAECQIMETFDSMDGFFMSGDLRFWERPSGFIFGDDDYFIGGIEDWAAELVQENQGYYRDYEDVADGYLNWVPDPINDEFTEPEVWELACQALGLGEQRDGSPFVVDHGLAHALLRPSGLYGRMRGVTPRMAADVLRRCAGGTDPQDAWSLVGQRLRESRLRELADVLHKTEAGVPATKVAAWTHSDLSQKLTHFSMQAADGPWITAAGAWCGGVSLWAYKLWGATAELSFGPAAQQTVALVSSTLLGLTALEGPALFGARLPAGVESEFDPVEWRGALKPEAASEVLRGLADGVFPSFIWGDIYHGQGLEAFADGTGENEGGEGEDDG